MKNFIGFFLFIIQVDFVRFQCIALIIHFDVIYQWNRNHRRVDLVKDDYKQVSIITIMKVYLL